jgi:amino acid adenylation domain-containing protein
MDTLLAAANKSPNQRTYWLNKLSGDLQCVGFPADVKEGKPGGAAVVGDEFPGDVSAAVLRVARQSDHGLHVVLAAGLIALLHRYSGARDITVGTPIYRQETRNHLINTILVLRCPIPPGCTFKDVLLTAGQTAGEAVEHQDYPFEVLEKQLTPAGFPGRFRLFDTALLLENIHDRAYLNRGSDSDHPVMSFIFRRDGQSINMVLQYNRARYGEETAAQIVRHFIALLRQGLRCPDQPLDGLDILSDREKKQLLVDFNDTVVSCPGAKTLHGLFGEQAVKTPDCIAVTTACRSGGSLTYRELDRRAACLAGALKLRGVRADDITGIMIEPSLAMIIALLGVLKSGAAYLPIDPSYPRERIDFMLKHSGAAILLTGGDIESLLTNPAEICSSFAEKNTLAYVIYTSGTTGRPKGAAIQHESAANTLLYRRDQYGMSVGDVSMQLFSYAFDGFITSFFTPLISGVRGVLLDSPGVKDIAIIKKTIVNEGVTHFISVPALCRVIIETLDIEEAARLRVVTLAGDRLDPGLLELTRRKNKHLEIAHEYGVTEASVMSTLRRHQERSDIITIGRPTGNTKIYILNEAYQPQPIGVTGQLYIAGTGLARGYLNNPELTREKFLRSFLQKATPRRAAGGKLYKTGDLGRWLADGAIEFAGRIDHQVKIRGYRIELGEIESYLTSHPRIREAVVGVMDSHLCAFVVLAPGGGGDIAGEIKAYLSRKLPGYMVPAYFTVLEKIPLTPNGKPDREALPRPVRNKTYEPPVNDTEKKLQVIWQEVLNRPGEAIGVHDDFFLLGGHSIQINVMAFRIEQDFGTVIPLADIYQRPTIRRLAGYIREAAAGPSVQGDRKLVLLRRGEGGKDRFNLFLIHDGTGEVDGYVDFCRLLEIPATCWGVRAGSIGADVTIPGLAGRYIQSIRRIQPGGPYHIAGWSLGGTIVFEMVRQLEQSGESIGFVALIDSPAPDEERARGGLDPVGEKTGNAALDALRYARRRYYPGNIIDSPLHYFETSHSSETGKTLKLFDSGKWKELTRGKTAYHQVPGDHFSIFKSRDVEDFARLFGQIILLATKVHEGTRRKSRFPG